MPVTPGTQQSLAKRLPPNAFKKGGGRSSSRHSTSRGGRRGGRK